MKTTRRCNHNGWSPRLIEWIEGQTAFISVVFSWQMQRAYQRAVWLWAEGYNVRAGGPAVALNPRYLEPVAQIGGIIDALPHHNPNATFTSRGCIRSCPFCAVPTTEGDLVELQNWEPKPIVCDNNLLACSRTHFDRVIDRLNGIPQVDFNQGLDARLLIPYHAERLAKLDLFCVRLAWDHIGEESAVRRAVDILVAAGIPRKRIRVFCLIGWNDTPEDALYRLTSVIQLGGYPNPMRYQPLDSRQKNEYVGPAWTHRELQRYMRYWANYFHLGSIPFAEFDMGLR